MKPGLIRNVFLFTSLLLIASSCQKDRDCDGIVQQDFNHTGFSRIVAGDNLELTIQKGPDFSIRAEGCAGDIEELSFSEGPGDVLKIDYETQRSDRSRVQLTITLPYLIMVNLSGAAKAAVRGFDGQAAVIRTYLSGATECAVTGAAINANFELSGSAQLTITGSTESLYGSMSGSSVLNSYGLTATEVDMEASGSAIAYVFPQAQIFAAASGNSRIYYKGNPATKHFEISGTAAIIQQ